MSRKFFAVFFLTLLTACAGTPSSGKLSTAPLVFSDIERIGFGSTPEKQLTETLGKPDQLIHLKQKDLTGYDVWVYLDSSGESPKERLTLLINRQTGIAKSATWIPSANEALSRRAGALTYFGKEGFKKVERGWIAGH